MSTLRTRQRRLAIVAWAALALLAAVKLPFLPVPAQPALLWLGVVALRIAAPELLPLAPLLLLGLWQDMLWQWPLGASLPSLFALYLVAHRLQRFASGFGRLWLAAGSAVALAGILEWAAFSFVQDAFMPPAPLLGRILSTWLCWPFVHWGCDRLLARWRLRATLRGRED